MTIDNFRDFMNKKGSVVVAYEPDMGARRLHDSYSEHAHHNNYPRRPFMSPRAATGAFGSLHPSGLTSKPSAGFSLPITARKRPESCYYRFSKMWQNLGSVSV